MGTTRTYITVGIDVPDHRDQDHEIERYELAKELTERVRAIAYEPRYEDITPLVDGGVER